MHESTNMAIDRVNNRVGDFQAGRRTLVDFS
jgi:hypothetical protein